MDETERKIKVLFVDDEADYLAVLYKRLTRRGFDICLAHNGEEGIQLLRRNEFHVAVVDLKMDDMDGLEVLKVFKAMDPGLAVIILTGHGSEKAAREGVALGAYDYLTKPCDLEDLIDKIKKAHATDGPRPIGGGG